MNDPMISGPLAFRPVEERDLDFVMAMRNDPSTWTQLTDPLPLYPGDQKRWLESLGRSSRKYYFIGDLVDASVPKSVALVRMDEHDPMNRSIRVGADVAAAFRRQGYGKLTYYWIRNYAFRTLNCHRIWLEVLETNYAALKLYELVGFKSEGVRREAIYRDGRYLNYLLMSILESEL